VKTVPCMYTGHNEQTGSSSNASGLLCTDTEFKSDRCIDCTD
jgi:hypothetical protein